MIVVCVDHIADAFIGAVDVLCLVTVCVCACVSVFVVCDERLFICWAVRVSRVMV